MGVSQPNKIELNVNFHLDSTLTKSNQLEGDVAPPPVSNLVVNAEAFGGDKKNIPINVKLNNCSNISSNLTSNLRPSESGDSFSSNIDNNIGNFKDHIDINTSDNKDNNKDNNINNSFLLFNNSKLNDNENDNFINNNNERKYNINNEINNNANQINNNNEINNNNINNEINNNGNQLNNNNFMNEGVKQVTKFGDEEDDKEKENSHQTCTGENIDMNRPINKDIENNEFKKPTDFGDNKDMNQGAGFNKPNDMGDNYNGFNFSNGDLELSQSVVLGELSKDKIVEYLQNGYFPLFFKINNYSPVFFVIKETSTLKSLAREYVRNCPQTDDGILENIEFYWKDKYLNKDLQIKYLQLKPCSVITNKAS